MTDHYITRESIQIETLSYDHRVQRREGTDMRRAAKMAEDFNPLALGLITVSRRSDGQNVVIDGAHRKEASILAGVKRMECTVHHGLTLQEEADLFVRLNTFKQPSAISRFLAGVVKGDPVAVDIHRIIEAHGWTVRGSHHTGCFAAVAAAENVYRRAAGTKPSGAYPEVLDWALGVITQAWQRDPKSATAQHLGAVAQVYGRFGDQIDKEGMAAVMAKATPSNVLAKARLMKDAQGGRVEAAMAKVLVGMYNQKRRTKLLPEWVWTR